MSSRTAFDKANLIICVGSGGVGKTTTAAAIAVQQACAGRRVLVLTIDPAKRLADAMGLAELDNEPKTVDLSSQGPGVGTLDAMMLDAKKTFDNLIRKTAGAESKSILDNRIYQIMTGHFAGTLEYMALERLYDIWQSKKWDLIVLDTPPSQNSRDFFTAPERTRQLFDEQVMKWFVPDMSKNTSFLRRAFHPGNAVLKLLSLVGGNEFISDLTEFFRAMSIVRESLHARGVKVHQILRAQDTKYIVVSSPDPRRVEEAVSLEDYLNTMDQRVSLFVLNRSHHQFRRADLAPIREAVANAPSAESEDALTRVSKFYNELVGLAERDRDGISRLREKVDPEIARIIPSISHDIHSLTELRKLGAIVMSGDPS